MYPSSIFFTLVLVAVTASVFEVSATAFQAPSLCFFLYTQTEYGSDRNGE